MTDIAAKLKELKAVTVAPQLKGTAFEGALNDLQDSIGEDVPQSYRDALPLIGGTGFTYVSYPTLEDVGSTEKQASIQAFFGLFTDAGDPYDLRSVAARHEDLTDRWQLLPIGLDPVGNLICIGLDDSCIYFFDSETDDISQIAEDLEGFIESMQVVEDKE